MEKSENGIISNDWKHSFVSWKSMVRDSSRRCRDGKKRYVFIAHKVASCGAGKWKGKPDFFFLFSLDPNLCILRSGGINDRTDDDRFEIWENISKINWIELPKVLPVITDAKNQTNVWRNENWIYCWFIIRRLTR